MARIGQINISFNEGDVYILDHINSLPLRQRAAYIKGLILKDMTLKKEEEFSSYKAMVDSSNKQVTRIQPSVENVTRKETSFNASKVVNSVKPRVETRINSSDNVKKESNINVSSMIDMG